MLNGYKIIALCLSRIQDATSIDFVSELNDKLIEQGYRIFLFHISTDLYWNEKNEDSEVLVFELIDYSIIDTIIIMDEKIKDKSVTERMIANAKRASVPVVIVDGHYENCVNVQFDYESGFEKIVKHVMVEHKPKKVHFMAGVKNNKFSDARIEVFRKVIEEYGISFQDSMVSYGDFWAKPAIKAMKKLITEKNIPEAIICANDIMAINVVAVLKSNGYRVPEDVIVTGFDGIEEVHLTEPRVTTAFCNYMKLADTVAELISQEAKCGDYYVSPVLMISESCGCMYSSKINILDRFNKLNSRFYRYQDDNRTLMQIAENIQNCKEMEEVPEKMANRVMGHMCCMLNQWCTDATINPLNTTQRCFEDKMYLLYDAKADMPFETREFERKEIVPRLKELLGQKYPLIFTELDFMNVSFGYACFYFNSCDNTDYMKIPQIVTALNSGIGGLLNRRYQNYLTKRIEHIYMHDALTGLYNRLGFTQECEKLIKRVKDDNTILTVVLADLDGLKSINDNYGHTAGDNAIKMVAKALQYGCPHEALCVRFGGDEMLAVMEGDYDIALIRAEVNKFLDAYNSTTNHSYTVSTSLGILQVKGTESMDFEELLKEVDKLMYNDKIRKKQSKMG